MRARRLTLRGDAEPDDVRGRRIAPGVLLAGLVLLSAAVLYSQAIRIGAWAPDEEYFVQLARVMGEHFPGSIRDVASVPDYNQRGIQRLTLLLLAFPLNALNGEAGFKLAHALMCLAFTSAAIPVYLLARGVRLSTAWSLAAAALTIAVPWAVLTTSFLTESVAYPAAVWAFWGAWRACAVPGTRSDLLALSLGIGAGVARTNLLALVAVAPVALIVQTALREGRRTPRVLAREHPLLAAAVAGGALVVALYGAGINVLSLVIGNYEIALGEAQWHTMAQKFAQQSSRIVAGVGILPAVLALAWSVAQVARRRSAEREAQALGLVVLLTLPPLLFSMIHAAPEERYLMLYAPLLIVAGVAALARRDAPAWGIVLAGALTAVLVARVPWPYVTDSGAFQTDPASAFFTRVVLARVVPDGLPGAPQLALAAAVLAGAVLVAVALRRPRPRQAALASVVLLAGLATLQVVQTRYAVVKRIEVAGAGPIGLDKRTWVDAIAGDEEVGMQGEGTAAERDYDPIWREIVFYNQRVQQFVSTRPGAFVYIPRNVTFRQAPMDPETGELKALDGRPLPRLMLVPTLFRERGLAEEPVASAPDGYLPVRLVRLRGTPRVTWHWTGPDRDGWFSAPKFLKADLHVYPAAREVGGRPCLTITLAAPANYRGVHRYTVTADGVRRTGALLAQTRASVQIPLGPRTRRIRVRASGDVEAAGGRRLSLQVADTRTGVCRGE